MSGRTVLTAAYLFDWIAGDPEWFPHPVRLIGNAVERGERTLRRGGQSPVVELAAGGAFTLSLVGAAYFATAKTITFVNRRSSKLGFVVETLLGWTCLASRSLHDEATTVVRALETGNISHARNRLARIVGRDTQQLDVHEISRAVIETVAESCSDGLIAPLFYLAIGGVPLAMAYKAVNTLDSMIGHADDRYFYFGKVAARLDDIANLVPSRLTALGITAAALVFKDASPTDAFATWTRDSTKHKSPNAGQPESAMAGALQVQLGGDNFYGGERMEAALIGDGYPRPSIEKASRAIQLAAVVSVLGAVAAILLRGRRR